MQNKHIVAILAIVAVVLIGGYLIINAVTNNSNYQPDNTIDPNQTGTTTGQNPATTTPGTSTSTKPIVSGNDRIKVNNLATSSAIKSPLTITGQAKGWYFEASFPVTILDANGQIVAQGPAQAQGDWMTSEFVPFKITLNFKAPATQTGTIVFENDNPSGLPQNHQEFRLPIKFSETSKDTTTIKLYYQNTKTTNADACSANSVTSVNRTVLKTATPIQDAIKLLIAGNITATEKAQGFTTQFPNQDFRLLGATVKNGTLTLEFTEVPSFTTGGACKMTILSEQIIKTAQQFPGINTVVFKPADLFQP